MEFNEAPVSSDLGQPVDNNAVNVESKSSAEEALKKIKWDIWRVTVVCPYCGKQGRTEVKKRPGRVPWILCVVLLFTIPFLSCVPVLMPSLMDIHHHCLHCHQKIGERRIY